MPERQLAFGADGCWWVDFRIPLYTGVIPAPLSSSQLRINVGAPAIGSGASSIETGATLRTVIAGRGEDPSGAWNG